MYRSQYKLFEKEAIYIAGPECFYTHGFDMLNAMRKKAESMGFLVTLPNDNPLDMENPDLQKRADSIMADLADDINKTTVILSDLEAYRGAEADSGTIYEIGMAYAKGARSYAYTRDKRSLASKNMGAVLKDGCLLDENGKLMPYSELPFCPNIIGSTKIAEGDFEDCLMMLAVDIEEEKKELTIKDTAYKKNKITEKKEKNHPLVFLSGFERYEEEGEKILMHMKELCKKYGLEAVSSLDWTSGVEKLETDHVYAWAANVFQNNQQHVRNCDVIIANLNNYRGFEINNDVAFECGMGYQLGKKLYGYMNDTRPLIDKIPHLGEKQGFCDSSGSNVENFNYPANLMFASTMKILEGKFEDVIEEMARDL